MEENHEYQPYDYVACFEKVITGVGRLQIIRTSFVYSDNSVFGYQNVGNSGKLSGNTCRMQDVVQRMISTTDTLSSGDALNLTCQT